MKPARWGDMDSEKTNQRSKNQKPSSKIEVFCRLKTLKNELEISTVHLRSTRELILSPPGNHPTAKKHFKYDFTHVFTGHADQKEVFEGVAMPLMYDLIHGKHGLLLTYGVTGSGKTYTMNGMCDDAGILPRCVNTLFNTIGSHLVPKHTFKSDKYHGYEVQSQRDAQMDRKLEEKNKPRTRRNENHSYHNDGVVINDFDDDYRYAVYVNYVEIYNNVIYDLLDEDINTRKLQAKILREGADQHVYVHNVCEYEVENPQEIYEILAIGAKRRKVAQTRLNVSSSRSHSIFTIRIVKVPAQHLSDHRRYTHANVKVTQLMLVDLAGSERGHRTQNTGVRLKEAGSINNCLMILRQCLRIMRDNQKSGLNTCIPYRERKLTHLFKSFFEGYGNISLIICLNPSFKDYDENLQVLDFAEMAKEVEFIHRSPPTVPLFKDHVFEEEEDEEEEEQLDSSNMSYVYEESLYYETACDSLSDRSMEVNSEISNRKPERVLSWISRSSLEKFISSTSTVTSLRKIRSRLQLLDDSTSNIQNKISVTHNLLKKQKSLASVLRKELDQKVKKNLELENKTIEQRNKIQNLQEEVLEHEFQKKQSQMETLRQKDKLEKFATQALMDKDRDMRRQREVLRAEYHGKVKSDINMEYLSSSHEEVQSRRENTQDQQPEGFVAPIRPAPVSNTRSRKSIENWLGHFPKHITPTNTVFQPVFRSRHSINKLRDIKSLTHNQRSRYILMSQGQDSEGTLKTNLFKGDILPTCSGGAQVIFDDVETLKQKDPLDWNSS